MAHGFRRFDMTQAGKSSSIRHVMTHLRRSLVRRPGLLLSWVLLALTSQALAVTLDWCLHGDDAHVELAATSHHGELPPVAHEDCHGADTAVPADANSDTCEGIMISAASDAAVAAVPLPDFHAVPAFILYLPPAADPLAASAWLAPRARTTLPEPSPRSRTPGVLAGTSTRLLI